MFAPPPTTWLAAVHAPYAPPMVGVHVNAPRPCTPLCHARPSATCDPTNVRAPPPWAPLVAGAHVAVHAPLPSRPTRYACPPFVPHETCAAPVHALQGVRTPRSRPIPCTPLQYKFIKKFVHSTTWASRPSTTMRWMTFWVFGW
jgi:hypothetical protein